MLGLKKNTVKLVKHDDNWHRLFLQTKKSLEKIIVNEVIDIEHIGSTAIKGVYAKPIIDIAIAIDNVEVINKIKNKLEKIGYEYRGDAGKEGGHLFIKETSPKFRTEHLHFVEANSDQWKNYIKFRDYLNKNKKVAEEYSNFKQELEKKYGNDRKAYTAAKQQFINDIFSRIKI